jgi:ATP phosphoribosyltransferase
MLRIAIPNKGALSEGALSLIKEAGYKCKRWSRELMVTDAENEVDFIFLRPRDIATYVSKGIIDLGITGRDLLLDSEADAKEVLPLGIGKSRFRYAVPKDSGLTPEKFGGLRVAASYVNLVKQDCAKRGVEVEVIKLDGAVEISVQLGVADVIADVVESGRTLKEAGLEVVGDTILESEAVVITGKNRELCDASQLFLKRLKGILVARNYKMIEYDVPKQALSAATALTPGIASPTIAPLHNPDWVAVKAMIKKNEVNSAMDGLAELGAKGIIITDISTCRI